MLEFQRHEIDKVAPLAGEDEALAAERVVAANAEKLGRLAAESYEALYDDDHAVLARLGHVWKRVGELAALDPRFQPYLESRDAVHAPLEDLARFLRDYAAGIDRSPDRLQAIEDRLAALERLKRRYGPTLDEVLARQAGIAADLAALDPASDHLEQLRRQAAEASRAYLEEATRLSDVRGAAATRLARALERSLADLAMAGTRCDLRVRRASDGVGWTATGIDLLDLYLSPNVGEELRPLARIASGGELSRVMLAMKTLASTDLPGKTLIFDEVDAGIGGGVADVVGERLQQLAGRCQVLCITHLPQVAAFADSHLRVVKAVAADRTVTRVERLDEDHRIEELARMMGGKAITDSVRAGARDLLTGRAGRKAKEQAKAKGESRSRLSERR
jgi:DNA repair protein RecN (Recombination protein N)